MALKMIMLTVAALFSATTAQEVGFTKVVDVDVDFASSPYTALVEPGSELGFRATLAPGEAIGFRVRRSSDMSVYYNRELRHGGEYPGDERVASLDWEYDSPQRELGYSTRFFFHMNTLATPTNAYMIVRERYGTQRGPLVLEWEIFPALLVSMGDIPSAPRYYPGVRKTVELTNNLLYKTTELGQSTLRYSVLGTLV